MKQLVIISGKGGTGKTIITAAIATLAQNKVMADCDVMQQISISCSNRKFKKHSRSREEKRLLSAMKNAHDAKSVSMYAVLMRLLKKKLKKYSSTPYPVKDAASVLISVLLVPLEWKRLFQENGMFPRPSMVPLFMQNLE